MNSENPLIDPSLTESTVSTVLNESPESTLLTESPESPESTVLNESPESTVSTESTELTELTDLSNSSVGGDGEATVAVCRELVVGELADLLGEFGVELVWLEDGEAIPASYWGEREAGIRGHRLFVRRDTPVHSALHEACHIVCAAAEGRPPLDTDAGGEQIEEDAVCYLQLVLSERLTGFGRARAEKDMDAWGYTFRLGSAAKWFASDAEDACAWLVSRGLLRH